MKEKLRQEHASEFDPLKSERDSLAAKDRRTDVETEVKGLSDLGFSEAPGLLKYYRRVLLSADAEEPGAVLMSDTELHLSGDVATGATGREEISVAGALRKFVELLPRNSEGKLELSDMMLATEDARAPRRGRRGRQGNHRRSQEESGKDHRSLSHSHPQALRGAASCQEGVTSNGVEHSHIASSCRRIWRSWSIRSTLMSRHQSCSTRLLSPLMVSPESASSKAGTLAVQERHQQAVRAVHRDGGTGRSGAFSRTLSGSLTVPRSRTLRQRCGTTVSGSALTASWTGLTHQAAVRTALPTCKFT